MVATTFFRRMMRVADDMMSAVFLGTSPVTIVVSILANAVAYAGS